MCQSGYDLLPHVANELAEPLILIEPVMPYVAGFVAAPNDRPIRKQPTLRHASRIPHNILDSHGDRIDKVAHQVIRLWLPSGRHGRADNNVGLRCVSIQQSVIGCHDGKRISTRRFACATEIRKTSIGHTGQQDRELRCAFHARCLVSCINDLRGDVQQQVSASLETWAASPVMYFTSFVSSNHTSVPLKVCSAGRGLSGKMFSTGRSPSSSCK